MNGRLINQGHTINQNHARTSSMSHQINLRFSNPHGRAHGRALGRPHTMRGDTAMRYGRVKTGKNFSLTQDAISGHGRATWLWEELFQILRAWAAASTRPHLNKFRWLTRSEPSLRRNHGGFFEIIEPTYFELTMELCSTFHLQVFMTNFDDLGTVQFRLGGLVCQLSILGFGIVLGLYTEKFIDDNELDTLHHHIYYYPSKCWKDLNGHVFDFAYFIALAIRHQTERHRREVISIGPYVTQLAQHFGLLNTMSQSSSLTLIGQMSPQGLSSMFHIRMIEKQRGTYPPQYRLVQSTEEEDLEDITDDVCPRHEDPPSQPPPIHRSVHAAASLSDISECLTRFEQQCF
ncbi:hypothetical protein GOBAR_AA12450 [Gossypium barbadense]|uniref:Uncharacterized protein n=1 Tax=Gossypium barbadense TaxID=3634 RepID=A0A2P5XXW5_GOSBA|nr:hypothetical protein GOBAR_AA12450 [Gossypium barbadense]